MNIINNFLSVKKSADSVSTSSYCLVAVTKKRDEAHILPMLKAGHIDYGENTVQEMTLKWSNLKQRFPHSRVHFIGKLQRNKVKDAVALADVIHSVESKRLCDAIAKANDLTGLNPTCFLQVNIGREPQKSGCVIEDIGALLEHSKTLGIPIEGFMCIPPNVENPRIYFKQLYALAQEYNVPSLSMGMSSDYIEALEEGATHIRVGSALFV